MKLFLLSLITLVTLSCNKKKYLYKDVISTFATEICNCLNKNKSTSLLYDECLFKTMSLNNDMLTSINIDPKKMDTNFFRFAKDVNNEMREICKLAFQSELDKDKKKQTEVQSSGRIKNLITSKDSSGTFIFLEENGGEKIISFSKSKFSITKMDTLKNYIIKYEQALDTPKNEYYYKLIEIIAKIQLKFSND